jgi:hypothetical protein
MKTKILIALPALLLACFFTNCSDNKTAATESTEVVQKDKTEEKPSTNADLDAGVPDFNDPSAKQYYAGYIAYLKKVVTSIRSKDEAGTMKIFREEGGQWDKDKDKMEALAKSTPEEEQEYNTWFLQSVMPLLQETVRSDYFKKYNEEYYKKVREDFKKKGY